MRVTSRFSVIIGAHSRFWRLWRARICAWRYTGRAGARCARSRSSCCSTCEWIRDWSSTARRSVDLFASDARHGAHRTAGRAQVDYMYFSTCHWARLLGGYSGFPRYSVNLIGRLEGVAVATASITSQARPAQPTSPTTARWRSARSMPDDARRSWRKFRPGTRRQRTWEGAKRSGSIGQVAPGSPVVLVVHGLALIPSHLEPKLPGNTS